MSAFAPSVNLTVLTVLTYLVACLRLSVCTVVAAALWGSLWDSVVCRPSVVGRSGTVAVDSELSSVEILNF